MDPAFHPPVTSQRVFQGACAVLTLVALAQGVAVAVAVARKEVPAAAGVPAVAPAAAEGTLASAAKPEAASMPVPAVPKKADPFDATAPVEDPHPELAGPVGDDPLLPDPVEPVVVRPAVAIPNAPLDVPITDEACLGHLDEGIYLRDRGDMVGAVAHLRKALELAPEHPKLLYQLAAALDGMSQPRKAAPLWRQIRLLGQDAGNYYQLAVERLKEGGSLPAPDEAAADADEQVKEGRFLVSHVTVQRLSDSLDAEVLRIEGQIDRKQEAPADVSLVDMKLHLFDEVNGQRIDRTTAMAPVIEWLDTPVDWKQGSERFRFEYRQPPLSPDELLKLGQRKYYGYAIEFRYDGNKLQDIAAEPSILADMALELPETVIAPPEGENFDPGAALTPPGQPDAVLFPGDKMDR